MRHVWTVVFISVLALVVSIGNVWAQATAQISGTVQDSSGALLPGAELTATQTETGISRMTVTNETGSYVLPNLPLGPYKLEAALPGFRTFVQTGIVLQVNSKPTINVTLQVGQLSEQVEVQANSALVETRSLSVGQVMETARIMELPLNGRNAQELILLQGWRRSTDDERTDVSGQITHRKRRFFRYLHRVHAGRHPSCGCLGWLSDASSFS
jgi:hypothetical protein